MANLNTVTLAGRLTDKAEKVEGAKISIAKFSVAINRFFMDKDNNRQEETDFIDCQAFGKNADFILQYGDKGRSCLLLGRLKLDKWQNKEGENRSRLMVNCENFQFTDKPKETTDTPTTSDRNEAKTPVKAKPKINKVPAQTDVDEPPF